MSRSNCWTRSPACWRSIPRRWSGRSGGARLQGHLRSLSAAHQPAGHRGTRIWATVSGPDDPAITALLGETGGGALARGRRSRRGRVRQVRSRSFPSGHADAGLLRLGAEELRRAQICSTRSSPIAPPPRSQKAATRIIEANEPAMTGIVFKIQANMDPNHRDRMAFMRVMRGKLTRGMRVKMCARARPWRWPHRSSFSRRTARWRKKLMPATSSAFRTAGCCASATPDRGRGHGLPRHPKLCAGNPAPRPPRGCDPRARSSRKR